MPLESSKSRNVILIDYLSQLNVKLKVDRHSLIYILVDENSKLHCLPLLIKELNLKEAPVIIEIKSGEENKTINTCLNIWDKLSQLNADRKSLLMNLGGGVLCDMGGFAASTYKRGIEYVNIPTTLLAMVDASIGGKTGFNLDIYKNQIGLFSRPYAVFIYPYFLNTLPHNELINGYAEIIKHALIKDFRYWNEINNNHFQNLKYLIEKSIDIKSEIVALDPYESDLRKILNFGHTVGHALEMLSSKIFDKFIGHGEAVAIGLICESFISYRISGLSEEELEEIVNLIKSIFPLLIIDKKHYQKIFNLMVFDKKNVNNKIKMVLLNKIGKAIFDIEVKKEIIFEAFDYYNDLHK